MTSEERLEIVKALLRACAAAAEASRECLSREDRDCIDSAWVSLEGVRYRLAHPDRCPIP